MSPAKCLKVTMEDMARGEDSLVTNIQCQEPESFCIMDVGTTALLVMSFF